MMTLEQALNYARMAKAIHAAKRDVPANHALVVLADEVEKLRQAGRDLLEVSDDLRLYTADWNWKYGDYWDEELIKARSAFDEN